MSRQYATLKAVKGILRAAPAAMTVTEIVKVAAATGVRLPTKSKTPRAVVARDLSMDIKLRGERSPFVRTEPGHYALRSAAP